MYKFKIPYKCLLPLVQQPKLLKAYIIYGKLKFICGKKGFYYNYKSDKQVLADTFGISQNTLRKYVGILKENGLVWESNRNLRLAHAYKIYDVFGLKPNVCTIEYSVKEDQISTRQIRLTYDELTPERIIALAIDFKQEQITFKQKEKISIGLKKGIGKIYCEKVRENAYKYLDQKVNKIYDRFSENSSYNFKTEGRLRYGFLDNNMCLESYAKLIGRKSKSTAANWLKRLEKKNLVLVERRSIPLGIPTSQCSVNVLRDTFGDSIFYNKKDNMYYKNIPSKITVRKTFRELDNLEPITTSTIRVCDSKMIASIVSDFLKNNDTRDREQMRRDFRELRDTRIINDNVVKALDGIITSITSSVSLTIN